MTLPTFSFTFRPDAVASKEVLESYGLAEISDVNEQTVTAKGKLQQALKVVYDYKPLMWTKAGDNSEAWKNDETTT